MLWAARMLARAVGMAWELLSRLRRRPAATDPAEELRSRLAEARARDPETAPGADEPAPEQAQELDQEQAAPVAPEPDLEDLRRDVRARAQALSEEMRGTNAED